MNPTEETRNTHIPMSGTDRESSNEGGHRTYTTWSDEGGHGTYTSFTRSDGGRTIVIINEIDNTLSVKDSIAIVVVSATLLFSIFAHCR